MDFPLAGKKRGYNRLVFMMCFVWAVVKTAQQIRKGHQMALPSSDITTLTIHMRHLWLTTSTSRSKYGKASSRTQEQEALATSDTQRLLGSLPPHAITVYTDGSALGNPGPAGAGAFICHVPSLGSNPTTHHLLQPLGLATNNIGEMWGIGMALSFILDGPLRRLLPLTRVIVLTDSLWTKSALQKGFCKDKFLSELLTEVQKLIDLIAKASVSKPKILWIPGHVDTHGNTVADMLAVKGSKLSKKLIAAGRMISSPPDFSDRVFRYHTYTRSGLHAY